MKNTKRIVILTNQVSMSDYRQLPGNTGRIRAYLDVEIYM